MKKQPRRPYSEQEIAKIAELKNKGLSWEKMGVELNRNPKALYSKFREIQISSAKAPARKYIKSKMPVPIEAVAHRERPMIALVGTPAEVTQTIRELFS